MSRAVNIVNKKKLHWENLRPKARTLTGAGILGSLVLTSGSIALGLQAHGHQSHPAYIPIKDTEREQVEEVVFGYQFRHYQQVKQRQAKFYCVSVGKGKDPPSGLVTRLRQFPMKLEVISQCRITSGGVHDRNNGARGVLFTVDSAQLVSRARAQVQASTFIDGKGGHNDIFWVIKRGSTWQVEKVVMQEVF